MGFFHGGGWIEGEGCIVGYMYTDVLDVSGCRENGLGCV